MFRKNRAFKGLEWSWGWPLSGMEVVEIDDLYLEVLSFDLVETKTVVLELQVNKTAVALELFGADDILCRGSIGAERDSREVTDFGT